jgi:2-methylcitrate dehydratase PrpD
MSKQPNLGAGIGTAHGLERRSVIAALAVAGIAGPARHCTRWEGWCRG